MSVQGLRIPRSIGNLVPIGARWKSWPGDYYGNLRASTQKSISRGLSLGLGCLRFRTVSCCRSARFSSPRFCEPTRQLLNENLPAQFTQGFAECWRTTAPSPAPHPQKQNPVVYTKVWTHLRRTEIGDESEAFAQGD